MRTSYRCLCRHCRTSYPTSYASCAFCKIPLDLVEVRRVEFNQDVPVNPPATTGEAR